MYAKWNDGNLYTVSFNVNGGNSEIEHITVQYGKEYTLPTPTKDGYTFGGWYTTEDFTGSAVTEIPKGSQGNKVFYAKWVEGDDDSSAELLISCKSSIDGIGIITTMLLAGAVYVFARKTKKN